MDLNQLEVFFRLAKVKNFTETARQMFVTQSAISHAIRKLEESVDMKLIERSGREFRLTPAGEGLFQSCERIFYEVEGAKDNLKRHRENPIWEINMGSPVEFGNTILVPLMKDFIEANPQYQLNFTFTNCLSDSLTTDAVDFIIDCREHFAPNLTRIQLFREEYVVIASSEYVHQNRLSELSDLERVNILSLDADLNWWRNFLVALPAHIRPVFQKVTRIDHVRGMINGAIAGLGVGFVPRYTVNRELTEGVLYELFPGIRPLADYFCIYIKQDKLALEKNLHLVEYLRGLTPVEFGNPTIRYSG